MAGIVDFLVNQFYTNQFMTAAVVAAPAAALTYAARSIPSGLWAFTKRNVSTDVRFNSDMENYERVQEYVLQNVVSRRWSRTYKYHAETKWSRDTNKQQFTSSLGVGYGNHFGWWHGRPVWINRQMEEAGATDKFKESLELTFLGRDVTLLERFVGVMEQAVHSDKEEERVPLYVNNGDSWERMASLPLRSLATVFTGSGQGARAVEHVRKFEESKAWYRQRGLPHHTGILLESVPGCGKTSLIHAVASETRRSLFYLNLGAIEEEKQISALMADRSRWDNAMLVVEDIDASGARVSRESTGGVVTLSTLLNVFDGILSPDGIVIMATTNHPEALDAALVRPGRFDLAMRLGPLEWPQFQQMAALFDLSAERIQQLQAAYKATPGATLRALMLSDEPDALDRYFAGERMELEVGAPPPVVSSGGDATGFARAMRAARLSEGDGPPPF